MSLLATLGLTPTAAMVRGVPVAALMSDRAASSRKSAPSRAATPSRGAESREASGDSGNDWADAAAANPLKEVPTPWGAYYCDWVDETNVGPILETVLQAMPDAKAAHAKSVKTTAQLMKVKKVVEAGPHSVEDITAEVTKHASRDAGDVAATVESSKNLAALVKDLLTAVHGDLVSAQTRWNIALDAYDIAADKQKAAALRAEVKKEKEAIDDTIKLVKTVFELGKSAIEWDAKGVASSAFELIVDAYHELNGQKRLERAAELEKMANEGEMINLGQAIDAVEVDLRKAVDAMESLKTRAEEVKEDEKEQRVRAALAFDEGSKGKLKLLPLMKALSGSTQLYGEAADASAKAKVARQAVGELARATGDEHARAADCRLVIDSMLKAARMWEESAGNTMARCQRLSAHWESLQNAALDAMRGANGKGKKLSEVVALD